MRVAIVRNLAAHAGGAETYADTIAQALEQRGHQISEFYELGAPASADESRPRWYAGKDAAEAVRALIAWQPDVLFVQGLRSTDLERRLIAIAPSVLFAHGYAGLCVSGHKMHRRPSPSPCERVFGLRCLALYFPLGCGGRSPLTALTEYRLQRERHRLIASYKRVVVGSTHMADEYARHGLGALVSILPLPLPPSSGAIGRVESDRRELLFCGRLERTKGPRIALDAAARATMRLGRRVRLTIAGAGSLERRLRRSADRLTRENPDFDVQFAGWIDRSERDRLFTRTDLLLVPSVWPEPFGLIGIEAGQYGVPAVGFDAGGIRDWLHDGINGRLVPGCEPRVDSFATAIHDCLVMEPTCRDALRAGARASAVAFHLDTHMTGLERTFEAAAGSPA